MLYLLHGLTFLVIEVAWVQLRILLMGIQNGVYQQENHLGVLKTLGIKFQMPFKALLMLDIQNMKVSKAIYIFFGANTAKWIWDSSSIKPKLDMGLFVDFCVSIYLILPVFAWCAHKIVLFGYTDNPMSSFGLIE